MYTVEDYKRFILESLIRKGIISVKHGAMWYNLCDTLKEITDTKEEYRTLRDDIYNFRKETKNNDIEKLIFKGTEGTFLENTGNGYSVPRTKDMLDFIRNSYDENNEQILYDCHNHPFPSTCFMSSGDLRELSENGSKYSFCSGGDGVFIIKNRNHRYDEKFIDNAERCQIKVSNKIMREFEEKYEQELKDMRKKWHIVGIGMDNSPEEMESYHHDVEKLFVPFVQKDMDKWSKLLNEEFKKRCDGDLECYYVSNHTN